MSVFDNYKECHICHTLSDDGGVDILEDDNGNFIGFGKWMCLDCLEDDNRRRLKESVNNGKLVYKN